MGWFWVGSRRAPGLFREEVAERRATDEVFETLVERAGLGVSVVVLFGRTEDEGNFLMRRIPGAVEEEDAAEAISSS